MIRILTQTNNFPKMNEYIMQMLQDINQASDVQHIKILVQYLAQKKIDVNHVLNMHDLLSKQPALQTEAEHQVTMVTLVYYYMLEQQWNNLFQLLNNTKNIEFLALKLIAYLQINRIDMAEKTLNQIRSVEEDHCLTTLCTCWLTLHNPKAPLSCFDKLIQNVNELSDKFGYSLKTYNILGTVLMIKGEYEKASQIFETAMNENGIYELAEGDPVLSTNNNELASIIFNYIKCHAVLNLSSSMVLPNYGQTGLQQCFLRSDPLSIKLFTILSQMKSPLAQQFFEERQKAETMFDEAVKLVA